MRRTKISPFVLGVLAPLLIAAEPAGRLSPELLRAARVVGWVAAGCAVVALLASAVGRRRRAAGSAALLGAVYAVYLTAAATALPAANEIKSHRSLCAAIREHVGSDRPVRGFHEWRWRASYSYYTGRPIPNIESVELLQEYWSRPDRVFLVVEQGSLQQARQVLGPATPLLERTVGRNTAYLFANRAALRPVP